MSRKKLKHSVLCGSSILYVFGVEHYATTDTVKYIKVDYLPFV